ncbi:bactofilin family protein [Ottowia sp.]|uniref:bactofilin family protein n=1 Tax=Ottowia sp. TaxID=1898956 RepID=UPI003A88C2A1
MFGNSSNSKDKSLSATANRQIDTVIAQHCTLDGDLSTQNSIKVDGTINGSLRCQGRAIVGESGLIKGDVHSADLLVIGRLEGNVHAENLHLHASAQIIGNIETRSLQVDPGARYSGTVTMREQASAAPSAAQPEGHGGTPAQRPRSSSAASAA